MSESAITSRTFEDLTTNFLKSWNFLLMLIKGVWAL
jgi:hypothetical protein